MSQFNIITACPIVENAAVLQPDCVSNWADVLSSLSEGCTFTVESHNITYTGAAALSSDQLMLLLAFDQDVVALASNSCLVVSCPPVEDDADQDGDGLPDYCNNTAATLSDATKLAVLDDDGCPSGFVTIDDIKADIVNEIINGGQLSFCDLFPTGIPEGSLVVSDRVLTVSSGCNLKSVPTDDISCDN